MVVSQKSVARQVTEELMVYLEGNFSTIVIVVTLALACAWSLSEKRE